VLEGIRKVLAHPVIMLRIGIYGEKKIKVGFTWKMAVKISCVYVYWRFVQLTYWRGKHRGNWHALVHMPSVFKKYVRHRLASKDIVTLGVMLSRCVCVHACLSAALVSVAKIIRCIHCSLVLILSRAVCHQQQQQQHCCTTSVLCAMWQYICRVGQLKWSQLTFLLVTFGTWMYR